MYTPILYLECVETQIYSSATTGLMRKNQMALTSPKDTSLLLTIVSALRLAITLPGIVVLCFARRLRKSSDYSLKNDILLAVIRR